MYRSGSGCWSDLPCQLWVAVEGEDLCEKRSQVAAFPGISRQGLLGESPSLASRWRQPLPKREAGGRGRVHGPQVFGRPPATQHVHPKANPVSGVPAGPGCTREARNPGPGERSVGTGQGVSWPAWPRASVRTAVGGRVRAGAAGVELRARCGALVRSLRNFGIRVLGWGSGAEPPGFGPGPRRLTNPCRDPTIPRPFRTPFLPPRPSRAVHDNAGGFPRPPRAGRAGGGMEMMDSGRGWEEPGPE